MRCEGAGKRGTGKVRRPHPVDMMTDPVEILKAIHWQSAQSEEGGTEVVAAPPYKYARSVEETYGELNEEQIGRLLAYVRSEIETEDQGRNKYMNRKVAQSIMEALACYAKVDISEGLLTLICMKWGKSTRLPRTFRNASPPVLNVLMSWLNFNRQSWNDGNESVLKVLAWVGTETVVQQFMQWIADPSQWEGIHMRPYPLEYALRRHAEDAGWELTGQGKRRDLYFPYLTRLKPGVSTQPQRFKAIVPRGDICPQCSGPLINLLELTPAAWGLMTGATSPEHLQVVACLRCVESRTIFGEYDSEGNSRVVGCEITLWKYDAIPGAPATLPTDCSVPPAGCDVTLPVDHIGRLPFCCLTPYGVGVAVQTARVEANEAYGSQLGGYLEQRDWFYPTCTCCGDKMMLLARICPHELVDDLPPRRYDPLCVYLPSVPDYGGALQLEVHLRVHEGIGLR